MVEMGMKPVFSMDSRWRVKADVVDCPALELMLPARKEIVETPFVDELRTACRGAIYRAMLNTTGGVDVAAEVRANALALGVKLPVASAKLKAWTPLFADEYSPKSVLQQRVSIPDDAIVMEASIPICDEHTFQRAVQKAGLAHRLCLKEPDYKGYPWYDEIPKATAITTTITTKSTTADGKTETMDDLRAQQKVPRIERPERITFTIHTVDASGRKDRIDVPADVAFVEEHYRWPEELSILVTSDSNITPWELAELMHDAYFTSSDDFEADSYEIQRKQYQQGTESAAIKLLNSAEEAIIANVRNAVYDAVIPCLPRGREARILIPAENAPPEIVISPAPPAKPETAA